MMQQCVEELGRDIVLGDNRPKRNLKVTDNTGPLGRVRTYNALGSDILMHFDLRVCEEG
jgi:hypothetical protein